MRILFVASEGLPFSKTGGLADVVEALSKALVVQGHEVAVVLPRYRGTKATAVVMPSLTIPMGGTRLRFPAIADGTQLNGVRYYFVDDPEYFDRDGLYGSSIGEYPDNPERYAEFCRAAIEVAKHVWPADVIHCHDWQTALVPVLLRTSYGDDPLMKDVPVVFSIHNMGYHGQFAKDVLERMGVPPSVFHPGGLEFFGNVNLLKGGLVYSDYLTTVSRKYAQEIQTPEYGEGQAYRRHLFGKRFDREAGVQAGSAGSVWIVPGAPEPAADRNRVALCGSKGLRSDCGKGTRVDARRPGAGGAGIGRAQVRRFVPGFGGGVSGSRGREDRLRQTCWRTKSRPEPICSSCLRATNPRG